MLSTLNWKILERKQTIARLSMLYKMRYRLVSLGDTKLRSAGHSYSTRSVEYSYTQPTAIRDYYKYSFYSWTISHYQKYHNTLCFPKHCFYFYFFGPTMVPRETGNNAYMEIYHGKCLHEINSQGKQHCPIHWLL